MVIHRFHAHTAHELVEHLRRRALEESIGRTLAPHTIDDVTALVILLDHFGNRMDVILQVGINRYRHVGILAGCIQSSHEGILVSHVTRQFQASHMGTVSTVVGDNLPGAVS